VMGVLAGEMKNDWPLEALKAQAILARTYVLKFIETKDSRYDGADISTDIEEAQAYNAQAVNDNVRSAVDKTHGMVISADGEYPYAWFHAHSGGKTELPSVALDYEGEDPQYLGVVESRDSQDAPDDVKSWNVTFSADQLREACRKLGVVTGEIESIEVASTGESGRVKEFLINGKAVSAPSLRIALGAAQLKSTLIDEIVFAGDEITFSGRGFGHGVGMSQWGAYGMAQEGYDAGGIITHYFQDVRIEKLWE